MFLLAIRTSSLKRPKHGRLSYLSVFWSDPGFFSSARLSDHRETARRPSRRIIRRRQGWAATRARAM